MFSCKTIALQALCLLMLPMCLHGQLAHNHNNSWNDGLRLIENKVDTTLQWLEKKQREKEMRELGIEPWRERYYLEVCGVVPLRYAEPPLLFDRATLIGLPKAEPIPEFPSDPGMAALTDEEKAAAIAEGENGKKGDGESGGDDGKPSQLEADPYENMDMYLPFSLRSPETPDRFIDPSQFLLYFQKDKASENIEATAVPFLLPNATSTAPLRSEATYQKTE